MDESDGRPALCPSAKAEPGAAVIGVLGPDGRVGYLRDWLETDQEVIEDVSREGLPEQRYRFANSCVEHKCAQWNGKCTIIERVSEAMTPIEEHSLQPCAIRTACRWFRQKGPDACRLCPMVITDTREDADAA